VSWQEIFVERITQKKKLYMFAKSLVDEDELFFPPGHINCLFKNMWPHRCLNRHSYVSFFFNFRELCGRGWVDGGVHKGPFSFLFLFMLLTKPLCLSILLTKALCFPLLLNAGVCWRMLTYADVCWRIKEFGAPPPTEPLVDDETPRPAGGSEDAFAEVSKRNWLVLSKLN
jgi:hypothetical protein